MAAKWLLACAVVAPALAHADEPASPEAAELFERGRELVKAGKHEEACPLFERSEELAPALGTELNLARCFAATNRLVEALHLFQRLIPRTVEAKQPQREAIARKGVAEVLARIPRIRIDAGGIPVTTQVRIDGVTVDADEPIVVDPGKHRVDADGARAVTVTVVERQLERVRLEPAEAAATAVPARPRPPIVWALGGAAAGTLFIGMITGISVLRVKDAGMHRCDDDTGRLICDERGAELLDHARTLTHVTTVFFVTGLGLAAATAVMEMRSRRADRRVASAWATPSAVGVTYQGAW